MLESRGDPLATERMALLLLDDLLDVPETGRARWIADRTADGAVKERLAALLEADRVSSLRTGGAVLGLSGPMPLPERIGQYRILGLIGRGGMGAVYRATRDAGDFSHDVAIKVIKPGLLSDVLAHRFRAERQTLASLQHPNIARLYDGGDTADGSPYIVMELIEGDPIDRWADRRNLGEDARLALVETAVRAVSHAHQRLVVHRDITPLNVLVQTGGIVKLIDFGIARPSDQLPLPPGASPREAAGTATDIAALGRLLARLFPAPGPELAAMIASCRAQPADPALSHAYPTADALAADIAALRTGHSVWAMRGGEMYRLRKFAVRNKPAVAAASMALVALVGGLVAVSVANAAAQQARADAEARFQQTRGIAKALLFDVYDAVSRVPGATKARETLAKTAIVYLDALADIEGAPADVRAEAGRGFVRLAEVTGGGQAQSLGRYADANTLLARADALLAPAYADHPRHQPTAIAYAALRLEQAGTNLYNNNDADTARAQAQAAQAAVAPFSTASVEAARLLATSLQTQGDSFGWNDDYERALPLHQQAETFLASLPAAFQADAGIRAARSANLRLLAEPQHKLQMTAQARATLDQAIAINRGLLADSPDDPAALRKLAVSLWYAAVVHRTNERDTEAKRAIGEAVSLANQMAARDPDDAGALQLQALTGEVLAQVYADGRDAVASKAATARVLAAHDRLVALARDAPGARRSRTAALRTSAGNLYNLGDIKAACRTWREVLASYLSLQSAKQLSTLDAQNGLPETQGYLRNFCEGALPVSAWPASL